MTAAPASVPIWVFFLFAGLVAIGLRQMRVRLVSPTRMAVISVALLALSVNGVLAAFGADTTALAGWTIGLAIALVGGPLLLHPTGLARAGAAVRVAGSGWPMILLLGIFGIRFVLGYANAVHAPFVHAPVFVALSSALLGAFSGAFATRAWAVVRFALGSEPAARSAA